MKGRLRTIGFHAARLLLALSCMALAVLVFPLLIAIWFRLTNAPGSANDATLVASLLKVTAPIALLAWLCFRLMRRWRPESLRHRPMKSKKTEMRIREISVAFWIVFFIGECLLHLPGTWLERAGLTLLSMALLWGGVHLGVAWHELGHWLAALAVGVEPLYFRLGTGPRLWRRLNPGGLLIEWHLLPSGGVVKAWRRDGQFHRGRHWLMIAGGPLASAALALGLWRLFPHWPSPSVHAWPYTGERVGFMLCIWSAFLTVITLVPHRGHFAGVAYPSDGLQLLSLLRPSKLSAEELKKAIHLQRMNFLWESGQHARAYDALREVEDSMAERPAWLDFPLGIFAIAEGNYAVARVAFERFLAQPDLPAEQQRVLRCQLAAAYAGLGDVRAARAQCLAVLRRVPAESRAVWFDRCASIPMLTAQPGLLRYALRWVDKALALDPTNQMFQLTKLALRIEQGDVVDAEADLRRLVRAPLDGNNRGAAAFYLALVLQRRKAPATEVVHWRQRALRWSPQLWLRRRIAVELPEGGEPTAGAELLRAA